VREHAHIDEVVTAAGVALKNAGGGQKKGLCPFHDEKSPSFHVTPSKNYYHCFGCGAGGDVIDFVMKTDHLSFTETIERLASQIGYTLRYEEGGPTQPTSQRSRLYAANLAAAKFYQDLLNTSPDAAHGRDLLTKRGFDKAACDAFGVGYAPNGWDGLTKHLRAAGFTIEELEEAGLSKMGERGPIDKFRNRVMWPIKDISGDVIGFGARKLASDEEDQGPKYLNTSETPIYKKSQVLYGLDMAKKDIAKSRQVVVVEGYTDVMACHLAGVTTAVATCGTAFGDDHIKILNRMLNSDGAPAQVIFTFDPDAAGQKAAMRAFEDSHKFSAHTFVAIGPDGLDPADLRQAKGDEAVQMMIQTKRPLFEFAIKQKLKKFDLVSLEGRVSAVRAAAPVIAGIRDEALRPAYVRELAGWVSMTPDEVARTVSEATKMHRANAVAGLRTDAPRTSQSPDAVPPTIAQSNGVLPQPVSYPPVNLNDPLARSERQTLDVLVQMPQAFNQAQLARLASAQMSAPAHNAVLEALVRALTTDADTWLGRIQKAIDPVLAQQLLAIAATPLPANTDAQLTAYASGVIGKALDRAIAQEKAHALAELRRTDASTDPSAYRALQERLVQLESERRAIIGE
jgi:DNA primase